MGFPVRPALSSFGPLTLRNISEPEDPSTDLDARHWNLMKFQVAGMGLLVPLIAAKLVVSSSSPSLIARAEVWNPRGLTTGSYAAPVLTPISTGRVTLTYPSSIPDEADVSQGIAFSWGYGFVHLDPPTTVKRVQVAPIAVTPNILTICAFSAANALEDGNTVWVFAG